MNAAPPQTLLDRWLPEYDVASHHSRRVNAAPAAVMAALRERGKNASRLGGLLMRVRFAGRNPAAGRLSALETLEKLSMTVLDETPPRGAAAGRRAADGEEAAREIVLGFAGRFWRPVPEILRTDAATFAEFARPGYAKVAVAFRAEADGAGATVLHTETRVQARGATARLFLKLYFGLIAPFSGLIRQGMLRRVAGLAEKVGSA